MNYETFTQFSTEFSAQTDLMNICEYINFLYKKFGLDGLMSVLRLQQYVVSHLHSDNRILRMNYMEHNRIWRPRWSRQTRGTIF